MQPARTQKFIQKLFSSIIIIMLVLSQFAGAVSHARADDNNPPVITAGDSISVLMNKDATPTAFALFLQATDLDGDLLTWSISSAASHGTASVSGTGNSKQIEYTPDAGYIGLDSFIVQVDDGAGGTDTTTVNVTITPWIRCSNDPGFCAFSETRLVRYGIDGGDYAYGKFTDGVVCALSTFGVDPDFGFAKHCDYYNNPLPVITEGASTSVIMSKDGSPTAFSLTLHATDEDTAVTLNWTISSSASNGTASLSGTGDSEDIGYVPNPGYVGLDSFAVQVDDGNGGTDDITVNVIVAPSELWTYCAEEGSLCSFSGTRLVRFGVDGGNYAYATFTNGANCSLGSFADPDVGLVKHCEYNGALPVITEGSSTSVTMSRDASPTPFGLTLHATDAETAATLTWSIATPASHGTASASGTGNSMEITYTPEAGTIGTDSFVVQVDDGAGGTDTISVNVNVIPDGPWNNCGNDGSLCSFTGTKLVRYGVEGQNYAYGTFTNGVACTTAAFGGDPDIGSAKHCDFYNDLPILTEGASTSVTMSQNGSPNTFALTLHATDADGDPLTWSISSPASHGTASANGTGNSQDISYTPNTDYTGSDSFVVQVDDGNGGTAGITVNVNIVALAPTVVTVICPVSVVYSGLAQTPCTANVTGDGLDQSIPVSYSANTNAGTAAASAAFAGDGTHPGSSNSTTFVITQADPICTVTPYNVMYDAAGHTASGACTGVDGASLPGLDLSGTIHTNAGSYTDTWTFTDNTGNYNNVTGTTTDAISKANATCTIIPYNITYDTAAHSAIGTCKGVGGTVITGINLSGTRHTYAGVYPTDPWSFSNNDYVSQNGTVLDIINKATPTCAVTRYTTTYNGNPHLATGSCTGVGNVTLVGLDVTHTNHTAVGVYNTDYWFFTDLTTNYNNVGNQIITDTITRAAPTCVVTPYNIPYDGLSHQPSVTCTGVKGETLTTVTLPAAHTASAVYADTWSLVESTGNYTNQLNQPITDTINFLPATCTITPYHVVYDALPHTPAYSCTNGSGGALTGSLTGVTHTTAGSYTDSWSFTDSTNIYKASGSVTDVITAAPTVTTITCPASVVYTGAALLPCTAVTTGIGGLNATGNLIQANYTNNTNVSAAPGATVTITYAANGNYLASTGTGSFLITQMPTTTTVTCPASVVYTGLPLTPCTAVVTGSTGGNLTNPAITWMYINNLNVGITASVTAAYPGDANHLHSSGNGSFTITNPILVCTVTPYTVTYDGNPHSATGSCITTDGVDYSSGLSLAGSTQTNYGTYPFTWTFHDSTDTLYSDQSGPISDSIARAPVPAGCNATQLGMYNGPYTGTPHGGPNPTNCKGVKGEDLGSLLTYSGIYINVTTGGILTWNFNQGYTNPNYASASGFGVIVITKANPTCTVTGYTGAYDGQSHAASGSCIGVLGEPLTTLDLSSTFHTLVGAYTSPWTFTSTSGNYNNASGTVTSLIVKAHARDDYDGDGKSDPVKFDPSTGIVWWLKSSTGQWDGLWMGSDTFQYISGSDFDGDGKTDPAKFYSAAGVVWWAKSTTGTLDGQWLGPDLFTYITGSDFDGDGKADPAKFYPGTGTVWWVKSTTGTLDGQWLGADSFQYISGSDFDGDGNADPAKFYPATGTVWWVRSSDHTMDGAWLGPDTFTYVGASDFDGDGKTDPAKFYSTDGTLWWVRSSDGVMDGAWLGPGTYQVIAGDDFNGDDKTDPAEYNASTNTLSWLDTTTGTWTNIDMGTGSYNVVNGQ